MMPGPGTPKTTRRSLLGGAAAAAMLPVAAAAAPLSATRDRAVFTALLYTLAGPVEVAPALLDSVAALFTAKYGQGAIDTLVAYFGSRGLAAALEPQPVPMIEAQIRWLTCALFTGSEDPHDSAARMVNYPLALGWKSLAFAKAPGLCAGPEFGYWGTDWGAI